MDSTGFEYVFPAIRGNQAGREYYVSMCPLGVIPKIFLFNEQEVDVEVRAQRTLNHSRVPEIAKYILENPRDYIFSALTASVDGDVRFEPMSGIKISKDLGSLHVPMTSKCLINDGQHRRAAIEMALQENPGLRDETIAIVFFKDLGLSRAQQMFADLNRTAVRASQSIAIQYDQRDELSKMVREIVRTIPIFDRLTDREKNSLAPRSSKLFTLSRLHAATKILIEGLPPGQPYSSRLKIATSFWTAICSHMKDWQYVFDNKVSAGDVRKDIINCHSLILSSLAGVGNALIKTYPDDWKIRIDALSQIDWSRHNSSAWNGRAIIGGNVTKNRATVALTTSYLKKTLELPLTSEEQKYEESFQVEMNGNK